MARAADPHRSREIEKALIRAGGKPDKTSTLAGVVTGARGKEIRKSLDEAAASAAAAEVGAMSLIARSVNQSLRRKRSESRGMTLSDSSELQGESDADGGIELPESMRAAADDGVKEWEFARSKLKLSAMLGEGQFGQVW